MKMEYATIVMNMMRRKKIHVLKGEAGKRKIQEITDFIKEQSKGRKYDCIIGISGGVDSSYLAYYAKKKMGLNPLAVHFDNGWNSEIAVKNIHHIVQKLGIDLYTYVINWEEFRDFTACLYSRFSNRHRSTN